MSTIPEKHPRAYCGPIYRTPQQRRQQAGTMGGSGGTIESQDDSRRATRRKTYTVGNIDQWVTRRRVLSSLTRLTYSTKTAVGLGMRIKARILT
jgi:hypothetical protein